MHPPVEVQNERLIEGGPITVKYNEKGPQIFCLTPPPLCWPGSRFIKESYAKS